MSLKEYHKKRDFDATGEPEGETAPDGGEGTLFVVQEHTARRHHFDLRLEHDGVLVSFAVPGAEEVKVGLNVYKSRK